MFRSFAADTGRLDDLLAALPDGWRRLELGPLRAVVGATGVFVLAEARGPDVATAAARACREAEDLRRRLSRAVVWTPFVEALVVVDEPGTPPATAAVVPGRLLHDLLLSGPELLDDEVVERIVHIAGSGSPTATTG